MFVSTIRKKNRSYEHNKFSYKHIPICYNEKFISYNETEGELPVNNSPSPANIDEQGKVKGEGTLFYFSISWGYRNEYYCLL